MGGSTGTKSRGTDDRGIPRRPDPGVASAKSGPRGNVQSKNAYNGELLGRKFPSLKKTRLYVDEFSGRTYRVGGRASPNKPRAQRTAVDADLAEVADYRDLLRKGEVGLAGPNGANVSGPDSITYDPASDKIFVNDSQTFWTEEPRAVKDTNVEPSWEEQAKRAAEHVDIEDANLAKRIRKAAARGRIVRRNHTPRRVAPPPDVPDEYVDIGADMDPDKAEIGRRRGQKRKASSSDPKSPENVRRKPRGKSKLRQASASDGTTYRGDPDSPKVAKAKASGKGKRRGGPTRATSHRYSGETPKPNLKRPPAKSPSLKKGAASSAGSVAPDKIKVGRGTFKPAKGLMKGLIVGLIQDWALSKIIGPYEEELAQVNYEIAARLFSGVLLPQVQDTLDSHYAAMFSVFSDPKNHPWPKHPLYLCLSWRLINRIEMDAGWGNVAVWIYRFPDGFAETIVRTELAPDFGVKKNALWYWKGKKPYPTGPHEVREFKERGDLLKGYTFVTSFLMWDPVVAKFAQQIRDKGLSKDALTTMGRFDFHQRFLFSVLAGDVFVAAMLKFGLDMADWVTGVTGIQAPGHNPSRAAARAR